MSPRSSDGAPAGAPFTPARSPLTLLHPRGAAARVEALGSAVPPGLGSSTPAAHAAADMIVVAPTAAECRRAGWQAQVAAAAARLADDGLLYLAAPAPWRAAARRLLVRAGLRPTLALVHVPDIAAGRYLVPLRRHALRYGLAGAVPSRATTRRALALLLALPGGLRAIHLAGPAIGECFQRPGAPPPFAWLDPGLAVGVLGVSHRTDAVTATLHRLDPATGALAGLAKVPLNSAGDERVLREAAAMQLHAPAARRAGARVAAPALAARAAPLLLQSAVAGTPASAALAAAPRRLPAVLDRLAGWLEGYARQTRVERVVDAAWLQRELLAPLEAVAPHLPAAYVARIAGLGRSFVGGAAPLCAAHGDLTMWNVLLGPDGSLGVIDWEDARAATFPLGDLLYGAVDAVAAAAHYADRPAAFRACFAPGGAWQPLVAGLRARLAAALGADAAWQELCFHACWLGYAAAELARGGPGPFVAIARWLGGPGGRALRLDDAH